MAVGTVESGTQSATGVHNLGSGSTSPGVYVAMWNLTAMGVSGVIRCYVLSKVLTGDTAEEAYSAYFQGVDGGGDPIQYSDPIVSMFSVQMGVEEIGANTISIPWALIRVADL
jgi:hypothetical protein